MHLQDSYPEPRLAFILLTSLNPFQITSLSPSLSPPPGHVKTPDIPQTSLPIAERGEIFREPPSSPRRRPGGERSISFRRAVPWVSPLLEGGS